MRCDDRERNHSKSGAWISSRGADFLLRSTRVEKMGSASMLVFHKADGMLHLRDLRIGHERFPDQPSALVLNHDRHRRLIQTHSDSRIPILLLVERVAKSVDVPNLSSQITVEMLESEHGLLGSVSKGADGSSRCDRAIVGVEGFVFVIVPRAVDRGQTPGIRAVAFEMAGIRYAVRLADE